MFSCNYLPLHHNAVEAHQCVRPQGTHCLSWWADIWVSLYAMIGMIDIVAKKDGSHPADEQKVRPCGGCMGTYLASETQMALIQYMQAALLRALALRGMPATIANAQADPRLAALALPGELLDPLLPEALSSGITSPSELGIDQLTPRALGELYETLAQAGRRSAGRFYTPPSVVTELTVRVLGAAAIASADDPLALTICDPAMGCGFFLLAALELLPPAERPKRAQHLYGFEQDAVAAMVARAIIGLALLDAGAAIPDLRARLITGDALQIDRWRAAFPTVIAAGGFDIVLGNPPYIDSQRMMRETPALRKEIARAWPTARGNWDVFVPFVELALHLLRPAGRCALIVPNRLLGADYARTLRSLLAEHAIEALLDYSAADVFAANIYPLAIIVRRLELPDVRPDQQIDVRVFATCADQPIRVVHNAQVAANILPRLGADWWPIFSPTIDLVERCLRYTIPLAELADIREAATVAEAYAIAPLIIDLGDGDFPDGHTKLVNTGTLDRYTIRWGQRPLRYLGQRYLRPAIEIAQLRAIHARLVPDGHQRIILAGLGQHLEGYADVEGKVLPAKTTVILTVTRTDLWALLGLLNSQVAAWLYRQLHGGLALRGGYLRVGARQVARFPVPRTLPTKLGELAYMRAAMPEGAAEIAEIEAQIDDLVAELYGIAGGAVHERSVHEPPLRGKGF